MSGKFGFPLRKRHQKEPTLSNMSHITKEESAFVNDPLFSNNAVDEYLEKPGETC